MQEKITFKADDATSIIFDKKNLLKQLRDPPQMFLMLNLNAIQPTVLSFLGGHLGQYAFMVCEYARISLVTTHAVFIR